MRNLSLLLHCVSWTRDEQPSALCTLNNGLNIAAYGERETEREKEKKISMALQIGVIVQKVMQSLRFFASFIYDSTIRIQRKPNVQHVDAVFVVVNCCLLE